MPLRKRICCTFLSSIILFSSWAQVQPAGRDSLSKDSLLTATAYSHALQVYHAYVAPPTALYRGSEYAGYPFLFWEGHPFFEDKFGRDGTVLYDGVLYDHVSILYDEVKELAIIYDADRLYKIALINEQLDRFTIEKHVFIRIADTTNSSAPSPGFYEQLYKGNLTLLKKEKKKVEEDLSVPSEGVRRFISTTVSYYIKKGNTYHPVNNKGSLLHVLKDRSKDIRKFIRKNDLGMRTDRENTLIKVLAWYDGSNQK